MFDKKYLLAIEEDIRSFKECPILMLEHDNYSVTNKTIMFCTKCNQKAAYPMDTSQPVMASLLKCSCCGTNQKIAYLNLNKN